MKAYIINLKKSVDRKKYMQEQLEKMFFLSAEFVEAVDARGMTEREKNVFFDTELFCKRYVKEVRPGEIGCTLSHQKCYRKLVESRDKYALILEDDIVIRHNIDTYIHQPRRKKTMSRVVEKKDRNLFSLITLEVFIYHKAV